MPLNLWAQLADLFLVVLKHPLNCTCKTCRQFVLKWLEAAARMEGK